MKTAERIMCFRNRGGFLFMDVLAGFAIMAASLLLFALATMQLTKLIHEGYSASLVDSIRLDGVGFELRRDERTSVAAFAGQGDMSVDGSTFAFPTYPTTAVGANWKTGASFLSAEVAHCLANGRALIVKPNTIVEENSWLVFLGSNGSVLASYRFHNMETSEGGKTGVTMSVERYAPVGVAPIALTRTHLIELYVPDATLAGVQADSLVTAAREAVAQDGRIHVSLPSPYLGGQTLYDSETPTLEARVAQTQNITLRPRFQP